MNKHDILWNKIRDFSLDDGSAVITFSSKLAAKQNWSISFTQKAIEEYKKFMLLCCISPTGASPSQIVDEVWHLHLTYTKSYWVDFCKNTLGKEIHHHPSAGGNQEDHKHQEWYKETLQLYKETFGEDPPKEIWSTPKKENDTGPTRKSPLAIAALLIFPFLFILLFFRQISPFSLSGPHFILFFLLYGTCVIIAYAIYRTGKKREIEKITIETIHDDASPFQIAHFLHGKHRAIQTALVDLLKRDLLAISPDKEFVVNVDHCKPLPDDPNPFTHVLMHEKKGAQHSYQRILDHWYNKAAFTHPSLDALEELANKKAAFYSFHIALYLMFILRLIQGIYNDKHVGFLIFEILVLAPIFHGVVWQFSNRTIIHEKALQIFKKQADNEIPTKYALNGLSAIREFGDSIILMGIFGSFADEGHAGTSSGGSSCGGSSCGGGGCGGGCGGCGGS